MTNELMQIDSNVKSIVNSIEIVNEVNKILEGKDKRQSIIALTNILAQIAIDNKDQYKEVRYFTNELECFLIKRKRLEEAKKHMKKDKSNDE